MDQPPRLLSSTFWAWATLTVWAVRGVAGGGLALGAVVLTSVASYFSAFVISDEGINFPKLTPECQGLLAFTGVALLLHSALWMLIIWAIERRQRAYWSWFSYSRAN